MGIVLTYEFGVGERKTILSIVQNGKQRNTVLIVMEREWDLGIKSMKAVKGRKKSFYRSKVKKKYVPVFRKIL